MKSFLLISFFFSLIAFSLQVQGIVRVKKILKKPQSTIKIIKKPTTVLKPVVTTTVVTSHNCKIGGLYKQLCMMDNENEIILNSPYKKRYQCYKEAICTYKSGKCQWLQTNQFKQCMNRIRSANVIQRGIIV